MLEDLSIGGGFQIPAEAWQKVRGAKWLHLKKADFRWCLAERRNWLRGFLVFYVYLIVFICVCWMLSEFRFGFRFVKLHELELTCTGLRRIIYPHLSLSQRVFDRLILTKHFRCFNKDTQWADGAADLLEALSQSTQLEELIFGFCYQIPAGAWQKVRSAKWLNLKKANFYQCLAERNGWRFSRLLRVFICLCWMLSELRPSWPVWV